MKLTCIRGWGLLLFFVIVDATNADLITIGPNGINSANLTLTGAGVSIGQVEAERPGKPPFDNADNSSAATVPAQVFIENGLIAPTANSLVEIFDTTVIPQEPHATWVAGVMIGTDPIAAGVAQDANLYASLGGNSNVGTPGWTAPESLAMAAQHVAKQDNGNVRAINMSILAPFDSVNPADGESTLTRFVDWSAREHDVLYIVAHRDNTVGATVGQPMDDYNGITVAASARIGGMGAYRQVATLNDYSVVGTPGFRGLVDLLAPGQDVTVPDVGDPDPIPPTATGSGTSFAAPHVTGTVALLQQHATNRMGSTGFDSDAQRHEVMKAVLLNSADKLIDNGTVMVGGSAVPQGGLLGMQRTVLKQNGTHTWLNSTAFTNANIPLDDQMGAGHLNASRGFTQFDAGEKVPGNLTDQTANVPVIGWDYNVTNFDNMNKYVIQGNLIEDSFISVTLAWDRHLQLLDDWDADGEFDADDGTNGPDTFFEFAFSNLDLHVVPVGSTTPIASSTAGQDISSVEHIFAQIPVTGQYEIWVENSHAFEQGGAYALAWWATTMFGGGGASTGDFDGDGTVDVGDYTVWKNSFGSSNAAADANGNGVVDAADYTIWRDNLGAMAGSGSLASVPEPSGLMLLAMAAICTGCIKSRGRVSCSRHDGTRQLQ